MEILSSLLIGLNRGRVRPGNLQAYLFARLLQQEVMRYGGITTGCEKGNKETEE
jgi:hypothetical protein